MFKRVLKIGLSLIISLGVVVSSVRVSFANTNDFAIIQTRLKDYIVSQDTFDDGAKVETCYVSKAENYLQLIQKDGSFADVDYSAKDSAANGVAWSPYLALDRLLAIAVAYHKEGHSLYHRDDVIEKLNQAIVYWKSVNPTSTNWWENQIGVQLRFARIATLMSGIMSDEAMNIMLSKLLEKKPVKKGTGQNNLWFDQNYVYYAIITENGTKYKNSLGSSKMIDLKELVDQYLSYCLVVQTDDQTAEAVQVDNSFFMHGKQFYSNGYGLSMFRDMSYWLYMLRDTQYAFSQDVVDLMADYMIDGTSWTIRGDIMELYLGYRPYDEAVGYQNYASAYIAPLERMVQVDKKRAKEYQKILDNIQGKSDSSGKNGNYYMWRSAYASHMRENYGVNIKMDSSQIIGGEWRGSWKGYDEDGGQLIYWTSSASSAISVDGDEYIHIYPTYDWAHVPGTTTAARIVKDYANSGRFTNGTEHTIGVSNGEYGATAYDMDKKGTQAKKGYFFFDDEFVALGAGITSTESVDIHTTLNQSEAKEVNVGGQKVDEGTKDKEYKTQWLYNDDIGYVFLDQQNVIVSNAQQKENPSLWSKEAKENVPSTFKAYLDHGKQPKDKKYAYIVVPDKTVDQVEQYANEIPITVVQNDEKIQAVRHDGLKLTQIHFYEAGTLEYKKGYQITVDQPCSVMIDESQEIRQISLAVNDTEANQSIHVILEHDHQKTQTTFVSEQLPYAGKTLTLNESSDNRYCASSYTDNHEVVKAFDGDEQTFWQSQSCQDQWISMFTENKKHLASMDILWGEHYASEYDVMVSQNGKDYQLLTSIKDGDGNTDTIELNGVYPYVKIVFRNTQGDCYEIKEIKWKASDSLSLNQKVEVSSTSTNDKSNTKEKAVDGDTSSRWSSLRNENDNWIIVDLGHYAQIDAMSILWESACSDDYDIQISSDKNHWITVKENMSTNGDLLDEYSFTEPIYGRYVKMHSHKSSQLKYGISIYEISIYGTYIQEDIIANKNVFSSTIKDSYIPTNVVDHKNNTSWISTDGEEQWIYAELDGIYTISHMTIDWGEQYACCYKVQVSDDLKDWITIKTVTDGQGGVEKISDLENAKAKYVRLLLSQSNDRAYQIIQWSVYGDFVESDFMENIALNKSASASSIKDSYSPQKAFDGSFDNTQGKESRWVSYRQKDYHEDVSDQWIQVDLQAIYDLTGVKLYWEGSGAKQYKILVSQDGEKWEEAYLEENGQPGISLISFSQKLRARYVKMQGIQPGSQYGYSLWEFEVYGNIYEEPIEPQVNIALNKESFASSEFIDPKDGNKIYKSSLAFDGLGTNETIDGKQSRWVSNRDSNDEWIYVDLGDVYDIHKVVLNWEGDHELKLEYKIQVSNDLKEWKDIEYVTDRERGIHQFEYDGITGRYVKMQGIQPGSQYGYSLWEFEVYGDAVLKPEDPQGNLALYKNSVASSEFIDPKDGNKIYKSSLAFDGLGTNETIDGKQSRWVSNRDSNDEWIYVDLGDVYDIHKVVLNWEGDHELKLEYKIQVSNDLKEWKDIEYVTDRERGIHQFEYDGITGRYVKMQGIQPGSQYGYSLWEFEVYGKSLKTLLKETYDQYKDIDISNSTPISVAEYQRALNHAITVYNNDQATYQDILEAIHQLKESVSKLIPMADKTSLKKVIREAYQQIETQQYTPLSIENLIKILNDAKILFSNDNATQDEVNKMIQELNDAIDQLVKKADKFNLTSLFNVAIQLDSNKYTSSSLKQVKDLLTQVEAVIDDGNATQDEVDKMYETLRQALDQLEEKEREDEVIENDQSVHIEEPIVDDEIEVSVKPNFSLQKDQSSVSNMVMQDKITETNDSTVLIPIIGLMSISIIGFIILRKKYDKK